MFENKVSRIIFEPKGQEVTGRLRKLCNEEFHTLHISLNIIRMPKGGQVWWSIQALYEWEK